MTLTNFNTQSRIYSHKYIAIAYSNNSLDRKKLYRQHLIVILVD